MPDLTTLIDRVKAAEGADRSLDAEIWFAFADHSETDADVLKQAKRHKGEIGKLFSAWFPGWRDNEAFVLRYTGSIDAALWLVEAKLRPAHPLMTVKLDGRFSNSHGDFWFAEITWPSQERQGRGRTAALSLLSALLTALSEGGDDG